MHEPKKILVFSFVLGVLTSFVATAASSKWITVGIQAPVPFPGILFTMWIFPYSIGLVVKSHNLISVLSRWRWYLLSITVFLFFFLIGEDYLGRASGIKTQAQFNLSGLLCATVFMLLIFAYHDKLPRIKILEVIGRGSYFVYLTHFRLLLYVASLWGFEMMGEKVMIVKYLFGMICFIAFYSSLIIITEHGLNKKIRCLVGL
jgi:peptidoglycan/LPS O-acetylase OafA/YrhL